jgi:hypothetical protein
MITDPVAVPPSFVPLPLAPLAPLTSSVGSLSLPTDSHDPSSISSNSDESILVGGDGEVTGLGEIGGLPEGVSGGEEEGEDDGKG